MTGCLRCIEEKTSKGMAVQEAIASSQTGEHKHGKIWLCENHHREIIAGTIISSFTEKEEEEKEKK